MCKAMEDMCDETVFTTKVTIIHQIMNRLDMSVQETLDVLEIPESERPRYIAAI